MSRSGGPSKISHDPFDPFGVRLRIRTLRVNSNVQGFFTQAVQVVTRCQKGMPVQHPRPPVSHHGPDPLSHRRLVAVGGAFGTSRLALLIGTLGETNPCILHEFRAFAAQLVLASVSVTAVQPYHRLERLPFPFHPSLLGRQGTSSVRDGGNR